MQEQISVQEALKQGRKNVKIPFNILCILPLVIVGISTWLLGVHFFLAFILGGIVAATISLTFYRYAATKWRIWAFSNVTNVHELKRAAITAQIIYPDNSWLEKFEIRNDSDKQKFNEIQKRFSKPDIFTDDHAVPWESLIYKSSYSLTNLGISFILFGILFLLVNVYWAVAIILSGFAIIILNRYSARNKSNKKPVIVINNKGITTPIAGYKEWYEVSNESVFFQKATGAMGIGSGNKRDYNVLQFDYPGGTEKIELSFLDINPEHLDHQLYVYRNRFLNNIN